MKRRINVILVAAAAFAAAFTGHAGEIRHFNGAVMMASTNTTHRIVSKAAR